MCKIAGGGEAREGRVYLQWSGAPGELKVVRGGAVWVASKSCLGGSSSECKGPEAGL